MLGLGFWELVIIGLIALIVIGPERLPEFAKSVAKFLNEMKRTASDLKSALDEEKDVFKDEIDRFQKLSQDLKNFPEENLLPDNLHKKVDPDQPHQPDINHPAEEQPDYGLHHHHDDFDHSHHHDNVDPDQLELLPSEELTKSDQNLDTDKTKG